MRTIVLYADENWTSRQPVQECQLELKNGRLRLWTYAMDYFKVTATLDAQGRLIPGNEMSSWLIERAGLSPVAQKSLSLAVDRWNQVRDKHEFSEWFHRASKAEQGQMKEMRHEAAEGTSVVLFDVPIQEVEWTWGILSWKIVENGREWKRFKFSLGPDQKLDPASGSALGANAFKVTFWTFEAARWRVGLQMARRSSKKP